MLYFAAVLTSLTDRGTRATGQDRIYDGYPDLRLDLVEGRTFEGGLQLLEYVPTVLDGPPRTTGAVS